jgi:alcohol dehydrogenase YqhD (iron-dependent ADH family)
METYFSFPEEGNPADDVSEGLMRGLIRDFRAALADPQDIQARSNIMWAASLAENRIIKTGKTKDFQAHNMEHQLSAYTNCNHGEGLAVLHPVYSARRRLHQPLLCRLDRMQTRHTVVDGRHLSAKNAERRIMNSKYCRYKEMLPWSGSLSEKRL